MCIVCFAGQPDEHAGATPCKLKCLCITKTICVLKCYNSQKKILDRKKICLKRVNDELLS